MTVEPNETRFTSTSNPPRLGIDILKKQGMNRPPPCSKVQVPPLEGHQFPIPLCLQLRTSPSV